MPSYNEPYVSENLVYALCHKGHSSGSYDTQSIYYSPMDVAIIYPRHAISANDTSDDFLVTLVVVSAEVFKIIAPQQIFKNRFCYELKPSFKLDEKQYADIEKIVDALSVVDKSKIKSRDQLLVNLLDVLVGLTDHFREQNCADEPAASTRLSQRLYDAIADNYRQHRDVDFYANLFCLSSKHFSTVVKQETGMPASYWIQQYIIIQAKQMLRKDLMATIQEIAYYLGFSDQTSFCRYFKRETGMTPLEYRKKVNAG
ncbi:MAG: AraC family transcriptional regulator [Bacteroidales bacterium]|nr:AraC family transcriptional regulator [Bacteroidales bacterium]